MSNNKKALHIAGALVAISVVCANVQAAEITSVFRAGVSKTDNIFLLPSNEIDETILSAGMSLNINDETRRTRTEIRLAADYLHYDEVVDPEWLAGLDGSFLVSLIDEKFDWIFEDIYGNQVTDALSSPNPGNRENVNFFSTGPNLSFPMGERFFLDVEGRYSTVDYSQSLNDDRRTKGLLEFGRRASGDSTYSVIASSEHVRFDGENGVDEFDVLEAFLNYNVGSDRNTVNIDIGYTEVDQGLRNLNGTLARVDWSRRMSQSQQFVLAGGTQFSTDGDVFRFTQQNGRDVTNTADINGNGTPFRNNFLSARYNFETDRTEFYFEGEFSEFDYELDPAAAVGFLATLNRDFSSFALGLRRGITRRVFVRVDSGTRVNDFKDINRKDEDLFVELRVGYQFSDAFSVFVSGTHIDRDSTVDLNDYTENRYTIGMEYVPPWGRR